MKSTILTVALAIAAVAQPNRHLRRHQHPHQVKRQTAQVDVVTDVVYATEAAAVVFVDQNGNPVSTFYANHPTPTGPWASDSWAKHTTAFVPPAPEHTTAASSPTSRPHHHRPSQTTAWPSSASSESSGSAGSSGSSTQSFGYGLSYSPYNNDGSCKSQEQVTADLGAFSGYGFIRSYGVDCNQATTILNAVQAKGMKMFAGIYDIGSVASETQELIDAVQNNWDSIYAVTVGNEAVNDGVATVAQVVAAVNQARSMLRSAGYTGPVATVDTSAQVISNPELCQASDFAAANCHAFFNADLTPSQAGPWVLEQANRVKQACGGKDTMITESGWPNQGDANGEAVPSLANQATAIQSLRGSFANNIILFSAFNNLWETNSPGMFNTNQYWGIYGYAPA